MRSARTIKRLSKSRMGVQVWSSRGCRLRHKTLEAYPTGVMDELLEGVGILLLTPSLSPYVPGAFLGAMRSIRKTE